MSGGRDNATSHARTWNEEYELDLIGREYCRDRSIACTKDEFQVLMFWQQAKGKLIVCHHKWIETVLEQCKLLKAVLRDHVYLEQSIDPVSYTHLRAHET